MVHIVEAIGCLQDAHDAACETSNERIRVVVQCPRVYPLGIRVQLERILALILVPLPTE